MYKIVIHRKVAKRLKAVPESYLRSLSALLDAMEENSVPWKDFDLKKIEGVDSTYRIRIGDYRVVYFVEKEKQTIHILKFDRREKVYKK